MPVAAVWVDGVFAEDFAAVVVDHGDGVGVDQDGHGLLDGGLLKTRRTKTNGHTGSANQPKPPTMTPGTTKASCTAEPDGKSSPAAATKAPTGYKAPSSSPSASPAGAGCRGDAQSS